MQKLTIFAILAACVIAESSMQAQSHSAGELKSTAEIAGRSIAARWPKGKDLYSAATEFEFDQMAVASGYTSREEITAFSAYLFMEVYRDLIARGLVEPLDKKVVQQMTARTAVVEEIPSTSVTCAITNNSWSGGALIVSGTLTNTNAVPVTIAKISTTGFDKKRKPVIAGSDYTMVHNDLAPGETVNFKVALKDGTKKIRFVKVTPNVVRQ